MKLLSKKREQGSILVVTLFTGLAVGIVLASYLTLISSRYNLTVRSMGWNAAMPVLEAGIEEALMHLHDDPASPGANGWTAGTFGGQPVYTKQRHFTDGSYFYVWIKDAASANPTIYSQGFVPSPLHTNQYISRTVRVGAANTPSTFIQAISTTGPITMNGNGVVVDGFDSRVGGYNTSTNRNATGGIGTDSMASGAIDLGNANVYGHANTGPGGTVSIGPNGAVGDTNWNASSKGIEPGWTNNNMNVAFPSNAPPTGGPFSAPPVTSNITYLATGTYEMSSFTSTKNPMIVTGHATLWVTGDFTVKGNGYVQIMTNASLTLIVGGTTKVAGGGVVNGTGLASQFSYIGLSSNTSIDFGGNTAFIGTINAPQADVTIHGTADSYGAVIGKTVTLKGNASFHYDQALAAATGLIVWSWIEL